MADQPFNIAKGRAVELANRVATNDPANSALVVILLQASEADAVLEDYDNLGALLTSAGNTEATFTNYARIVLTDADISVPTPDDTNNRQNIDFADQTWTAAGGATNNTTTKLLVCYDPDTTSGDDTTIIPISHHDFAATTDGNDLIAQLSAEGFYRAA